MYRCLVAVLYYLLASSYAALQEEKCDKDGVAGTCVHITQCQTAIDDVRNHKHPKLCGFNGTVPVVCCIVSVPGALYTPEVQPVATVPSIPISSTTEYIPETYDYVTIEKEQCEPVPPVMTSPKTGQKAWDKCIEYQEKLVYPCEKTVAIAGGKSRSNHCYHAVDELIVGGSNTALGEFPHMVLLGFGDDISTAQWACGGTLISERFILTAGHCTYARQYGNVTYARLGVLRTSQKTSDSKLYKIKRAISHPEYKLSSKYYDIALLETETEMKLDQFAVPACLDVGKETNYDKAFATGWGTLSFLGKSADTLQKVTLTKFNDSECSEKYTPMLRLQKGLDTKTQICYGDHTYSKDSCQGDSGGPLQVRNSHVSCMYTVIGVTSFGKACGVVDVPGIYTWIQYFVPWIENIVWS